MFAKNSSQDHSDNITLIGPSVIVEGDFVSDESVEFRGTMKGNIKVSGDIRFANSADVVGDVEAKNIVIEGSVTGNCSAEGDICIEKRGALKGDAHVGQNFTVKPGATFLGASKMIEKADVEIEEDTGDDEFDLDDL